MLLYSVFSYLCIIVQVCSVVYVLKRLLNKNRKERLEFVRTFKNGQCAFVLIPTFIIIFMGLNYENTGLNSFFKAITLSLKFVVMGFDFSGLEQLMKIDIPYQIAVYLDCFHIVFNVWMVVVSIFKQRVHYIITNRKFLKTKANIVLIAGFSKANRAIYLSSPKDSVVFIFCPLTKEEKNYLYNEGIEFLTLPEGKVIHRIFSSLGENESLESKGESHESQSKLCEGGIKQNFNIFINTGDDVKNIALSNILLSHMKNSKVFTEKHCDRLSVYVFGSSHKKNLYLELEEKGSACFHYVDEYRLAVYDLIENHPMASFFDERHINSDATIRIDIDLKVFLIGFGKTNTELFLQSVSNDQFVTRNENNEPVHKSVRYYLFDRKKILENSNLNYSYNRYKAFKKLKKHDLEDGRYLPIAPDPAEENLIPMQDIDSKTFFHSLRENLSSGDNDINFISVSLNKDIESIDLANKIISKCREWGLNNTHVSARVRDREEAVNIASRELLLWGDFKSSVFNYDMITKKKFEQMSILHNYIYEQKKKLGDGVPIIIPSDFFDNMKYRREWYKVKDRMQREASFNVLLNMKTKLRLMGIKDIDNPTLKTISDTIKNLSEDARDNLARQEHYRWNAHYICNGYIPMSTAFIRENPKINRDIKLRKQSNLLEFDALYTYEKITGKNVIQFDSQAVEEIVEILTQFEDANSDKSKSEAEKGLTISSSV